ncbi:unnamed protein product [Microthlaspi erraticum]|uniref:Uncharacterized protein n=1 Tax=Microthlaspi erraticum TaxID=1685480 RepID=A0A6D2IPW3_9BRAS|nr:unnamed protein product [Microthlaspi erraticum]
MPNIYFGKSLKTIYSMDLIKTTSPCAPSELAFQCNWIHIIWMSRKGVMIDLVKTGPDGSNRELASRPYGTADRGTSVPRAANVRTHRASRLNARPSSRTDPGSINPRSTNPKPRELRPRTTAPREQEGNAS